MSVSKLAVQRPITTYMIFIAVVLLGVVSAMRLAVDLLPEIEFPAISIYTMYEGVGPEEMETLITRPIEETVSTVQGLDKLESFSGEGMSRVQLQFAWGVSLDSALNDVRAAIERIRGTLPEEAETPVVFKFDLSSFPIMYLTLSGDMEPWRLRRLAEDTIKYRLERVEGVASADVRGGLRREIHVDLDADRLSALHITAAEVAEAIKRENVNLPGGDVIDDGREVIVRTLGEFESVAAIPEVIVAVREGAPLRVRDIGTVSDSFEDPENIVLVDGKPGVRLAIAKLSGANTVEVADRVREEVERINRDVPGVTVQARFDTSQYIRESIDNLKVGVLFGAGLAVFVLLLFLGSVRATLVIATAIPIAAVGTFSLMYLGGLTLNMISFGGLALGIGMLVDNAIVVLESIQRHKERGMAPKEAAVVGSGEVATAITASTLTTLSIFVPVVFIEGFAGIFFGQMAAVVSFSLICSLAVALMLIPVLAARGRAAPQKDPSGERRRWTAALERAYGAALGGALRWPALVFLVLTACLATAVYLFPRIGRELMPEGDQGEIRVDGELAVGTPLDKTVSVIRGIETQIREAVPELDTLMSVAGPPGYWSNAGKNGVGLRVSLVDLKRRSRSADEVAGVIRPIVTRVPGLTARVRAGERFWLFRLIRGGGERISLDVRGFDSRTAEALAAEVADIVKGVDGVEDVDVDRKPGGREAVLTIDRERAADLGLSVSAVGDAISTYVLGKAATYYREGGDEFTVLVQLEEKDRETSATFESLPLITPSGARVTLGDVAHIVKRDAPVSIRRVNQERVITVSGGFAGRDLGAIMAEIQERVAEIEVPYGFEIATGGEAKEQKEAFLQLVIGLGLAIILVFMVMASLFESLVHPLIMLFAIPFSAIGVVGTLLLTHTTLNVFSFMGIIVLTGVVVNNAIVLVDYINQLRSRGTPLTDAVLEASKRRLRPILMTTLTTVLALIPVAIGLSEGSELQAPLARVLVGGLAASTLITLVFVPTLYHTVERLRERWAAGRLVRP
jgi:hydrophobic/amphiphilic exporter-1 (mainly G- bacteria), HAE1 family